MTLGLLRMLGSLADAVVGEGRIRAVRHETGLVMADAARMIPNAADLDDVLTIGDHVLRALDRRLARLTRLDGGPARRALRHRSA